MELVQFYLHFFIKIITTIFLAFLLLLFFKFSLLDLDPGAKIIADPDPQPC